MQFKVGERYWCDATYFDTKRILVVTKQDELGIDFENELETRSSRTHRKMIIHFPWTVIWNYMEKDLIHHFDQAKYDEVNKKRKRRHE